MKQSYNNSAVFQMFDVEKQVFFLCKIAASLLVYAFRKNADFCFLSPFNSVSFFYFVFDNVAFPGNKLAAGIYLLRIS